MTTIMTEPAMITVRKYKDPSFPSANNVKVKLYAFLFLGSLRKQQAPRRPKLKGKSLDSDKR